MSSNEWMFMAGVLTGIILLVFVEYTDNIKKGK